MTATLVRVNDPTDASEARRQARRLAEPLGFDDVAGGRLAIVVSEAATNLLKHAGGGDIVLSETAAGDRRGIQMVAIDNGRGISDLSRSLADGFSTAGTAGTGLGAIRRASADFDVYSTERGTVVTATVYPDGAVAPHAPASGIRVAAPGEPECGDDWATWSAGELSSVFVCDGLGHGVGAAQAARTAVEAFHRHAERSAPEVVAHVSDALRKTRGAAIALAELDRRQGSLRYCGVGNISGVVVRPGGTEQHLVSHMGIAGHGAVRIQAFTYEWPPGSLLIMHSDGVSTRWTLSSYPGLAFRRPEVVAAVLYRDHVRGRDDATVVVSRHDVAHGA